MGSVVSAHLFVTKAVHATTYCPLGTGCDVVQSSRYAVAFGIPVGLLVLAIGFGGLALVGAFVRRRTLD